MWQANPAMWQAPKPQYYNLIQWTSLVINNIFNKCCIGNLPRTIQHLETQTAQSLSSCTFFIPFIQITQDVNVFVPTWISPLSKIAFLDDYKIILEDLEYIMVHPWNASEIILSLSSESSSPFFYVVVIIWIITSISPIVGLHSFIGSVHYILNIYMVFLHYNLHALSDSCDVMLSRVFIWSIWFLRMFQRGSLAATVSWQKSFTAATDSFWYHWKIPGIS